MRIRKLGGRASPEFPTPNGQLLWGLTSEVHFFFKSNFLELPMGCAEIRQIASILIIMSTFQKPGRSPSLEQDFRHFAKRSGFHCVVYGVE